MANFKNTVIYLGNYSDGIADMDQGLLGSAENAGALLCTTFDNSTLQLTNVTFVDCGLALRMDT